MARPQLHCNASHNITIYISLHFNISLHRNISLHHNISLHFNIFSLHFNISLHINISLHRNGETTSSAQGSPAAALN